MWVGTDNEMLLFGGMNVVTGSSGTVCDDHPTALFCVVVFVISGEGR